MFRIDMEFRQGAINDQSTLHPPRYSPGLFLTPITSLFSSDWLRSTKPTGTVAPKLLQRRVTAAAAATAQ